MKLGRAGDFADCPVVVDDDNDDEISDYHENCRPFTTAISSIAISDFSSFVVAVPSFLSSELSSIFDAASHFDTVSNFAALDI
jgi:hypothetical protein